MSLAPERLGVALDVVPLAASPSGVGVFCANLFGELARRPDVDLHAYAVSSHPEAAKRGLPPGVPFVTRRMPSRIANAAWRHISLPSAESLAGGAQVVHGTNYVVPPSRRLARVVSVHDMTAWRYPEMCARATLAYPGLVAREIGSGAFVHCPSRYVADEVAFLGGTNPDRVSVVPLAPAPAPAQAVEAAAAARGIVPSQPFVLAIGTVEPRKDYPGLVRAFSELRSEVEDLKLVIAGTEAWGSEALDAAVAASGCGGSVLRLGYVDDATRAALLGRAAVLAYPSVYEGFGMTPLEAMAAGVPVVATDGGSIPEVLGDGAVIVPTGDVAQLASALLMVITDDSARSDLVRRGAARAASYTWEATGAGMVALYREALRG